MKSIFVVVTLIELLRKYYGRDLMHDCCQHKDPPEKDKRVTAKGEYTCPMHPEIVSDKPGSCPKCGMALEPTAAAAAEKNPELADMSKRFWVCLALSLPLLFTAMGAMIPGFESLAQLPLTRWFQFLFATPVVLWGGWRFFQRAYDSISQRSPNMFTLIAIGTGAAYFFSVAALLFPQIFPVSFQTHDGQIGLYF